MILVQCGMETADGLTRHGKFAVLAQATQWAVMRLINPSNPDNKGVVWRIVSAVDAMPSLHLALSPTQQEGVHTPVGLQKYPNAAPQ